MLAALPALPSDRCGQFGWHCPLLCPGWRPILGLSGLLQKCRLLHEPDKAWDISHLALVRPWLIAGPVCSPVCSPVTVASNRICDISHGLRQLQVSVLLPKWLQGNVYISTLEPLEELHSCFKMLMQSVPASFRLQSRGQTWLNEAGFNGNAGQRKKNKTEQNNCLMESSGRTARSLQLKVSLKEQTAPQRACQLVNEVSVIHDWHKRLPAEACLLCYEWKRSSIYDLRDVENVIILLSSHTTQMNAKCSDGTLQPLV